MAEEAVEVKLDFRVYEILDRVHVIQCQFSDFIGEHEAMEDYPDLKAKADQAADFLMQLHQAAFQKWYEQNPDLFKKPASPPTGEKE